MNTEFELDGRTLCGAHVINDLNKLDIYNPLKNAEIRYRPNPFNPMRKVQSFIERLEAMPGFEDTIAKERSEDMRLLYVAFTRARDRLILAYPDRMETLTLNMLQPGFDKYLLGRGIEHKDFYINDEIEIQETRSQAKVPNVNYEERDYPPAVIQPSKVEGKRAQVKEVYKLGDRLTVGKTESDNDFGDCIHSFLAVYLREDLSEAQSESLAERLRQNWHMSETITNEVLVNSGLRLKRWLTSSFGEYEIFTEMPVSQNLECGSVLKGTVDLAIRVENQWIIIDHKSFQGGHVVAMEKGKSYSSQLAAYADAIEVATSEKVIKTMIHYPISGMLVELIGQEA